MGGRWTANADELPPVSGAYALLIHVNRTLALPSHCQAQDLPPGTYLYVGSARGPGGIRARCRRHLRPDKSIHWHVDRLTIGAEPGRIFAMAFPGMSECALGAAVSVLGPGVAPVIGFGNTDCRSCTAHLFSIGRGLSRGTISEALEAAD